MIRISNNVMIMDDEVEMNAIRSQGAGGQNVNKVSTAIHLRFDIMASSLPDTYKERLLKHNDHHITNDGLIIIKAQKHRTQEQNREDAKKRLVEIIQKAMIVKKKRKPTKPSKASKAKRLDNKNHKGKIKAMRKKIDY